MSLPDQVIEDVLFLNMDSKQFRRLMEYWRKQDGLLVTEILSPMTDTETRETLVGVRDLFKREVIDIVEQATKELEKKKE